MKLPLLCLIFAIANAAFATSSAYPHTSFIEAPVFDNEPLRQWLAEVNANATVLQSLWNEADWSWATDISPEHEAAGVAAAMRYQSFSPTAASVIQMVSSGTCKSYKFTLNFEALLSGKVCIAAPCSFTLITSGWHLSNVAHKARFPTPHQHCDLPNRFIACHQCSVNGVSGPRYNTCFFTRSPCPRNFCLQQHAPAQPLSGADVVQCVVQTFPPSFVSNSRLL